MNKFYAARLFRGASSKGLTLVEVMVSMLVTAAFLSAALQSYVSAVSIKAKTQVANAAIAGIQSDAETIRQMALKSKAQLTPGSCQASNYAKQLMMEVVTNRDQDLYKKSTSDFPSQSKGWRVETVPTAPNASQLTQQSTTLPLITFLPQDETLQRTLPPEDYQLRRTMTVDESGRADATNVLKIAYEVTNRPKSTSIAQLQTSVIPNAALVCP